MEEPLVSFIVPTYNRAYILGEALASIRAQTYINWEAIVVDDGSTDGTRGVVEGLHERIRYVFQENAGQSKARNRGLEEAKGEWVAYLDSDNTLEPDFLSTMLRELEKHPGTVWAFPRGYRFMELWENGKLLKSIDTSAQYPSTVAPIDIVHWRFKPDMNGFMHAKSSGISFDEKLRKLEDWELFLAYAKEYPENFLYVNEPLYTYHQRFGGDGVVSNSTYKSMAETFEYIYAKHKDDPLMEGQAWYPAKVEKWNRLQQEFEAGRLPPYQLYYFQ